MVARRSLPHCDGCRATVRATHDARKSAARRGASAGARYTLADIGNRDRWRCHLCGHPVDSTLPGRHPMGPTRDHLVPVSAGGMDDPANVRLAHQRCNSMRGTKPLAV